MYRLIITVFALAVSGGSPSFGQQPAEPVDIPVVFAVDGEQTFSGMAFSLERADYDNLTFQDVRSQPASAEVEAFFALVKAFQSGSTEAVMGLSEMGAYEQEEDRREFIEAYQEAFADQWEQLELIARYDHSGRSTFIWQVPSETGPFIRSFAMSGRDDGFRWVESPRRGQSDLMDTLLKQTEQLLLEGNTYSLPEDFRFSERIPESGIFAKFNGTILHWDVYGSIRPDLAVADVYSRAFAAFKARDFETFAGFYTPESSEKFLGWINEMPAEELDAYHAEMIEGREVRFILDADPFHVIYYNTPNGVSYDVIHREGDTFRLTGFYINSFIDKLLRDRNFFIVPVIARITQQEDDPVAFVPVGTLTEAVDPAEERAEQEKPAENVSAEEEGRMDKESIDSSGPHGDEQPIWPWLLLALALAVIFTVLKLKKSQTS